MKSLLIRNCTVISPDEILERQNVYCRDGQIIRVGPDGSGTDRDSWPEAAEVVDAAGRYLAPGYIDLHIHGTLNHLIDNGPEDLAQLCRVLPRFGVTGFLPSVTPQITGDPDAEARRLAELAAGRYEGTSILGFFLEGHFLALTGAIAGIPHDYRLERVIQLREALAPYRAIFGISPEIPGILSLLPEMTRDGQPAFITHTCATAEQTTAAIAAGATHATHFYDVFPYIGQKEPGVRGCGTVEAILADPRTSVDFIFDTEHVDAIALKMALRCLGTDKVSLITDANTNAGLPAGRYKSLGGREIEVAYDGAPARCGPEWEFPGALNGSGLTMDKAVRNAYALLDIPLTQAVTMASLNPARVLGLDGRKGRIRPGYDADLVLLDSELKVQACWISGRRCLS